MLLKHPLDSYRLLKIDIQVFLYEWSTAWNESMCSFNLRCFVIYHYCLLI